MVEKTPDFVLRHWRSASGSRKPSLRPTSLSIPDAAFDLDSTAAAANGVINLNQWKEDDTGYTSLRDILSSRTGSVIANSPTPRAASEIQIKNWLVKQAAFAYLQSTPSAEETCRRHRRFSLRRAIGSCFGFIGRILRKIRIRK